MALSRSFGSRQPNGDRAATATIQRPTVPLPPEPVRLPEASQEPSRIPEPPGRGAFPWGGTLALIGSLAVIVSAILDWGGPFRSTLPRDISATWLLEPSGVVTSPSLGLVMLMAGTVGALVSLVGMAAPALTFLRRLVGLLTLMIPMGFAFRTLQLEEGATIPDLGNLIGPGAALAAAGALLQLAISRPRR